jgi:hypothetical protein
VETKLMTMNAEALQAWKGRSETAHDQVTAAPVAAKPQSF